jgi:hypothetical protein
MFSERPGQSIKGDVVGAIPGARSEARRATAGRQHCSQISQAVHLHEDSGGSRAGAGVRMRTTLAFAAAGAAPDRFPVGGQALGLIAAGIGQQILLTPRKGDSRPSVRPAERRQVASATFRLRFDYSPKNRMRWNPISDCLSRGSPSTET